MEHQQYQPVRRNCIMEHKTTIAEFAALDSTAAVGRERGDAIAAYGRTGEVADDALASWAYMWIAAWRLGLNYEVIADDDEGRWQEKYEQIEDLAVKIADADLAELAVESTIEEWEKFTPTAEQVREAGLKYYWKNGNLGAIGETHDNPAGVYFAVAADRLGTEVDVADVGFDPWRDEMRVVDLAFDIAAADVRARHKAKLAAAIDRIVGEGKLQVDVLADALVAEGWRAESV